MERLTTLTLTDGALTALAGRPDIHREFPFIRVNAPRMGGTCCGGRRKDMAAYQAALDAVKRQLIGMSDEQKAKFKKMLNVTQVVVFLGGGTRQTF